jgi:hypothetical protein
MINRRNYLILAVVTLVLFVVTGLIGQDHDVLWILDDVLFFSLLLSGVLLLAMTVAVLVRAVSRRRVTG